MHGTDYIAYKFSRKPVKKVLRVLTSQLHLDDYWRRIIGEIIELKQEEGGDGVLLEVEGEGGQDNLGGDLEEEELDGGKLTRDPQLLGVPAPYLTGDTVSSLQQFLSSAQLEGLRCPGEEPATRLRKISMARRRSSTASTKSGLNQLLEQTTLGEFLTAVDNVRRKSVMVGEPGSGMGGSLTEDVRKKSLLSGRLGPGLGLVSDPRRRSMMAGGLALEESAVVNDRRKSVIAGGPGGVSVQRPGLSSEGGRIVSNIARKLSFMPGIVVSQPEEEARKTEDIVHHTLHM